MIYALENTVGVRGGNNRFFWFCGLHYNQKPSGWNGFCTLADFYDKFEDVDTRRGAAYTGVTNVTGLRVGLLEGQQFDQNGTPLKDRKGNNLAFTRKVALQETGNDLEITGIRVIKNAAPISHRVSTVMLRRTRCLPSRRRDADEGRSFTEKRQRCRCSHHHE